jgi:transposase
MTVTVLDRALVVGDAGRVTGERQDRPDPEVPERARRRTFTVQYKLDVVGRHLPVDTPRRPSAQACIPAFS